MINRGKAGLGRCVFVNCCLPAIAAIGKHCGIFIYAFIFKNLSFPMQLTLLVILPLRPDKIPVIIYVQIIVGKTRPVVFVPVYFCINYLVAIRFRLIQYILQ